MQSKEQKLNAIIPDITPDTIPRILSSYPEIKEPGKLVSLLRSHLKRRAEVGDRFQILLYTYNAQEGIGEYIHLLDFFLYYREVIKDYPEIDLRALCLVAPPKIAAIRRQLEYRKDLSKDDIYIAQLSEGPFDEKLAMNRSFSFWVEDGKLEQSVLDARRKPLINFTQRHSASVLISAKIGIAFSKDILTHNHIFAYTAPSACYRQAINEMGHRPYFRGSKGPVECKAPHSHMILTDSLGMGVNGEYHAGIKFNREILSHVISGKSSSELLGSLEDKYLLGKLLGGLTTTEFIENNHLYFSYLQSAYHTEYFLRTALAISNKPQTVIITNQNHWNQRTFALWIKITTAHSVRCLDLNGMSEYDKNILETISEIDGSSGDSSHSAQISGAFGFPKFPFFQARPWSVCFFVDILHEIKNIFPYFICLQKIFSYFISMTEDIRGTRAKIFRDLGAFPAWNEIIEVNEKDYCEFVKIYKTKIIHEFNHYCKYLYQHRNVIHEQRNILFRALISSILMKGSNIELEQLINILQTWKIANTNFLFILLVAEKWDTLEKLYGVNKPLFLQSLKEKHPLIKESAFSFALSHVNDQPTSAEMLLKIMRYGIYFEEGVPIENFIEQAINLGNARLTQIWLNTISRKNGSHLDIDLALTVDPEQKSSEKPILPPFKIYRSGEFTYFPVDTILNETKGRSNGKWKKLVADGINEIIFEKQDVSKDGQIPAMEPNYAIRGVSSYAGFFESSYKPRYAVFEYLMSLIANSYLDEAALPALLLQDSVSEVCSVCTVKKDSPEIYPSLDNLIKLLPRLILRKIILRDADITTENFVDTFIIDLTDSFMIHLSENVETYKFEFDDLLKLDIVFIPFEIIKWLKLRDGECTGNLPDLNKWKNLIIINYSACINIILTTLRSIEINIEKNLSYRKKIIYAAKPYLTKKKCVFIQNELKKSERYFSMFSDRCNRFNFINIFSEAKLHYQPDFEEIQPLDFNLNSPEGAAGDSQKKSASTLITPSTEPALSSTLLSFLSSSSTSSISSSIPRRLG